jgi:hypothetical protein
MFNAEHKGTQRRLECFPKSGNRFSDKKHDQTEGKSVAG